MTLHQKLEKRFRWYKKWHRFRYAQLVHYAILAIAVSYDLYLFVLIQRVFSLY
jgi:hypothetical protein